MLIKIRKSKKINFFLKNSNNNYFFGTYTNLYKFINIKFFLKKKYIKNKFFISKYFFLQNFFSKKNSFLLNKLFINYINIIKNVRNTKIEYFFSFLKNVVNYLVFFASKFFSVLITRDIWNHGLFFFFQESNIFFQKKLGQQKKKRKKRVYKNFINSLHIKSILPSKNNGSTVIFLSNFKKGYPKLRCIKFCDYGNRYKTIINKNMLKYAYNKFLNFNYNFNKHLFFNKKYFQYLYSTRNLNKINILKNFYNIKEFVRVTTNIVPIYYNILKVKLKTYFRKKYIACQFFNFFFRLKPNFYLTKYLKVKFRFKKSYLLILKKNKIKHFKFFHIKVFKKQFNFFKTKARKEYYIVLKKFYINNLFLKTRKYMKIKKFFYFHIFFKYYAFNIYNTKKKKKLYRRRFFYRLKFLRRKWNFYRFFKINIRYVISSLFSKLKKKFITNFKNYLNFLFFKIFNKDNNVGLNVNKSIITSQNLLNLSEFNKFSLLFVNKINTYKYINVFINNLYTFFFKKITNQNILKISIFKYIYVYLKFLAKRKNYNYFNINNKNINKLKNKRKSFIFNFFSFYASKRFYLNKFNLLYIWKKINIDFLFSNVLKKYRYLQSYVSSLNINSSIFFIKDIKFFFNKRCLYLDYYNNYYLLNLNFQNILVFKQITNKLNMYKQLFYFFNNLKKKILFNFVKTQDNKFLYKKNFLSWNMISFWKFYIIFLNFINNNLKTNTIHDLKFFFSYIYNMDHLINVDFKKTNSVPLNFKVLQINLFKTLEIFNQKERTFFFNKFFSIYLKFLLKKNILFYKKNWRNLLYKYNSCFYFYRKIYKKFFSKWAKKRNSLFFLNRKDKGLKKLRKDHKRNFLSNKKTQYTGFFFFKQWHHKIYRKLFYKLRSKFKHKLKYKKNLILKKKKYLKKAILRLRVKYVFRLKKYLNLYNTCSYYNYFKRRLYKRKKTYKFFFNFFKKNYRKKSILKKKNIISQIGIISIIIFLNNTYVTLTDVYGNVLFVRSGGLVGIKGPNRSTSVTSEEVTANVCTFVQKKKIKFLILKFSGVLYSRKIKAALKVFNFFKKLKILKVINNTPKSHNGIRLKKKKRL